MGCFKILILSLCNNNLSTSPCLSVKVNNIVIQQLLEMSKAKTLTKFLATDLSGITPAIAKRLIERLGDAYDEDMNPSHLDDKRITRLVQLLRTSDDLFKSPDGGCLSPLGEYNLNLGIQKVCV